MPDSNNGEIITGELDLDLCAHCARTFSGVQRILLTSNSTASGEAVQMLLADQQNHGRDFRYRTKERSQHPPHLCWMPSKCFKHGANRSFPVASLRMVPQATMN